MNIICQKWIKSPKISESSKRYILGLPEKTIDSMFTNEKMKFGTAGIRQIIGPGTNRMNSFTYAQMAHGYAQYILAKKPEGARVVIGHDNRINADLFTMVCAKVLTSFGIEVYLYNNNQLMPTPIVSFTIRHYSLDGGLMITASHNPKNYLGFKAYNETGAQILPNEAAFIEQEMPENEIILDLEYQENNELISYLDDAIVHEYYQAAQSCLIHTNINEEKNFPIVFTAHHGTASYLMPQFLETLGYTNVVPVKQQCVPDPKFTYSATSNPEDPSSFELSEKYAEKITDVKKQDVSIMLGVDPDADRLAVVVKHNGTWRYLTGNEMGIIFTYYVLSNKQFTHKPYIVSTYVSTYLIDSIAKAFKAHVYRTGTGFKWHGDMINKKSPREELVVAFEEAIGSLNSTIGRDKDGFQAAALTLEIFDFYRKREMTLIDLLENEIYPTFGYWAGCTVSYTFQGFEWQQEMQAKMNQFAAYNNKSNLQIYDCKLKSCKWNEAADALEWDFDKGIFIKFRMSGTEPKFKAYFNIYGSSNEDAKLRLNAFKEYIAYLMRA